MNKIAFISGATSGIGKACAEKFAKGNYDLIITGRRKERLETLKNELGNKYAIKIESGSGATWTNNVNAGYPTSNAWQSNLNGSYFNNFTPNTDVSEILRFI